MANGGLYTIHGEAPLKGFYLLQRRRLQGAVGDIVELDEVDVAQRARAELDERFHLRIVVVDAVYHRVFIRRATSGLFDILLNRLVKARQRVFLNTGHELVARALNGGMKGNRECELLGELGKALDSRDDAAGGDREVACADFKSTGGVQHAERVNNRIEVHEGFSLTHEDDAGNALAEIVGDVQHLVDHLLCRQRARESSEAGRAEGAAHGAARLGGNAYGKLVLGGHADGFHRGTVAELQEVLP